LAREQKKSFVVKSSSPPFKRQKLLGVNKNNEIIVVDDTPSSPSRTSPKKKSVRSCRVIGAPEKASADFPQPVVAPANGCIAGVSVQSKTATVECREQRCKNMVDVATEVICIDDDDDEDPVLVLSESPKADTCAAMTSDKNGERPPDSSLVSPEALEVVTQSVVAARADSLTADLHSLVKNSDKKSAVCITVDDTADNKLLPSSSEQPTSTSEQVSGSCLSTLSSDVDIQEHISPTSSAARPHHSSQAEKIARLERLLEVGLLPLHKDAWLFVFVERLWFLPCDAMHSRY